MSATIITADGLGRDATRELFNEGFSGYLVPLHLDAAAFDTHLERNDIDLASSPVLVDERPVAFALVGIRDAEAWIGGMGTVPEARRGGHGTRVLTAALGAARSRGCARVSLEVIDANRAALGLYERLGFAVTRDLLVWSLPPGTATDTPDGASELSVEAARAWIARHRTESEPWQRADPVLERLARQDVDLRALGVGERSAPLGAAIYVAGGDAASVIQVLARDDDVAATLIRSASAGRTVRLANVAVDDPASHAMRRLGGELVARQHEMRLVL